MLMDCDVRELRADGLDIVEHVLLVRLKIGGDCSIKWKL
jgi:hypothetical protein